MFMGDDSGADRYTVISPGDDSGAGRRGGGAWSRPEGRRSVESTQKYKRVVS